MTGLAPALLFAILPVGGELASASAMVIVLATVAAFALRTSQRQRAQS